VPDKHNENAKLIVKCCIKDGIEPIYFNQGTWFVRSHYTDLWRFHKISEDESINMRECIMKFDESRIISAIERFEKLKERREIFVI
jgi:hypothetical protein